MLTIYMNEMTHTHMCVRACMYVLCICIHVYILTHSLLFHLQEQNTPENFMEADAKIAHCQ